MNTQYIPFIKLALHVTLNWRIWDGKKLEIGMGHFFTLSDIKSSELCTCDPRSPLRGFTVNPFLAKSFLPYQGAPKGAPSDLQFAGLFKTQVMAVRPELVPPTLSPLLAQHTRCCMAEKKTHRSLSHHPRSTRTLGIRTAEQHCPLDHPALDVCN